MIILYSRDKLEKIFGRSYGSHIDTSLNNLDADIMYEKIALEVDVIIRDILNTLYY